MTRCRRIRPEDAVKVRELYEDLVSRSFERFPPEGKASYLASWRTEDIARCAGDPARVMLGAFDEAGKAIGLMFGAAPDGWVGTVIWLGVRKDARSGGIGRELMSQAFDAYRALGCHKLKLCTESEDARRFYLRLGMKEEGFHPKHWWKVDFWSLALDL